MTPADVYDRIDRQVEAGDYNDIDWAWQDRQADLAEECARDEYEEARAE